MKQSPIEWFAELSDAIPYEIHLIVPEIKRILNVDFSYMELSANVDVFAAVPGNIVKRCYQLAIGRYMNVPGHVGEPFYEVHIHLPQANSFDLDAVATHLRCNSTIMSVISHVPLMPFSTPDLALCVKVKNYCATEFCSDWFDTNEFRDVSFCLMHQFVVDAAHIYAAIWEFARLMDASKIKFAVVDRLGYKELQCDFPDVTTCGTFRLMLNEILRSMDVQEEVKYGYRRKSIAIGIPEAVEHGFSLGGFA